MSDTFQFRHYDYVLPIASLAAGEQKRLPLQIETDSSFILRGRAVHVRTDVAGYEGQALALADYFDRFTGPDNDDLADGLTRFYAQSRILGQYGLFLPVREPVIYPAGSTMYVDVLNNGSTDLERLELYFRGQKVFAPGVLPCFTYPEKMITRPYDIPISVNLPMCAVRRDQRMQVPSWADFVFRSLSIGAFDPVAEPGDPANLYYQVYVQLKDPDGRTYSNLPVHVDTAYGAAGSLQAGATQAQSFGNWIPPLLAPEIYLPATTYLNFDLYRSDTFVGGLNDITMWLNFSGALVWRQ